MQSVIKLKIEGIDFHTGDKIYVKKTLTCDGMNFVDKVVPKLEINGGKYELPETIITAMQQADEYISEQNDFLRDVIHDPDCELSCIINWQVVSVENIDATQSKNIIVAPLKKEKISDVQYFDLVFNSFNKRVEIDFDPGFRDAFLHTYIEMKPALKGMSRNKKMSVVLRAMGIGLMASSTAYQRMTEILTHKDNKTLEEADRKWPTKQLK